MQVLPLHEEADVLIKIVGSFYVSVPWDLGKLFCVVLSTHICKKIIAFYNDMIESHSQINIFFIFSVC